MSSDELLMETEQLTHSWAMNSIEVHMQLYLCSAPLE